MIIRWGVAINVHEKLDDTIRIAKKLDAVGIDRLWVVDFPSPRFAPAVADVVASCTEAKIGIGLLSAILYDAETIGGFIETLSDYHGNRFDVLIGPGDQSALRSIGQETWIPKEVVETTLGTTVRVRNLLQEKGIEGHVWLGAQGPRMIDASREAHGVLLNYSDPMMIEWALKQIRERDGTHQTGVFFPSYIVSELADEPPNEFLYAAAIVALGAPSKIIKDMALWGISEARGAYNRKGKLNSAVIQAFGTCSLLRWGVFTTAEGVIEYANNLDKIGIDEIVFGPPISQFENSLENLMAAFKKSKKARNQ